MKTMKREWCRHAGVLLCALLMTAAPWLDMAPARNARPDASDFFGYVYQLIARTFASFQVDRLAAALLLVVCVWLCRRYLFCKPEGTGAGEYALCAFLAVMTLLCTAVRTEDTVAVLWENAFQLAKAALFVCGVYLLFLTLLRALQNALKKERQASLPSSLKDLGGNHSYRRSFLILAAAWLPQILIRYPGVLMWDSYMQIMQFMGAAERLSSHPPFGTLVYGLLAWLGAAVDSRNLVYFIFTLVQCACYIAVLAYTLQTMERMGVPRRIRRLALLLYALSPVYAGWATVISKDTMFQIPFLWMTALLLECLYDREAFYAGWRKPAALGVCFLVMALSRHNGAPVAAVVTLALLVMLPSGAPRGRSAARLLTCSAAAFILAFGLEAAISAAMNIQDRYMQDVMSLPFQQTARVVKLHGEEIPQEEREIIDRVLDYDSLAEGYSDWYADNVKDTYRQTATAEDRRAYWGVWWRQLCRWPVEYLDAALHMNGVLFDLRNNEPMYISFSDMELDTYVYPWSFNDMTMYDREALVPLNSAQRALTEWYMDFDKLPLIGLCASMSFNVIAMFCLIYLSLVDGRRGTLLVWLPALVTFVTCLFSPVVYLRYALPIIGAMPAGLAACVVRMESEEKRR